MYFERNWTERGMWHGPHAQYKYPEGNVGTMKIVSTGM